MISHNVKNLFHYNNRAKKTLISNFSSSQAIPKENEKSQQLFFKIMIFVGAATGTVIGGGNAYKAVKNNDWKDVYKASAILSSGLVGGVVGAGLGTCVGAGIVYLSPFKGAIATIACSTPPLFLSYNALDGNVKTSLKDEIIKLKIYFINTAIKYLSEEEKSLQNKLKDIKEQNPKK